MKGVGAIIVTHNSEGEIGACLDALLPRVERVVVVDNASTDGTLDRVRQRPQARLIANLENRGFAAACNQGAQTVDTPQILLVNPDAVLLTGLEKLAEACAEADVGAAAGRLVDKTGRPQTGFSIRRLPTPSALAFEALGLNRLWRGNPVNRSYRCLDLDLDAPAEVEQPAAAFLMIRRDAWQAVAGMDEGFWPIWFEDVDLLKRLHGAGYRIRYVPLVVARHLGGHSVGRIAEEARVAWWYGSLLRYSCKHFQATGRLGVVAAVVTGCFGRMVFGVLREWNLHPLTVYGRVIRFACLRSPSGRIGEAGSRPARARR